MPTIGVNKYDLFRALGENYTTDRFQDLCFDFGIELDDDTEDDPSRPKDEAPQLKIEIPANRYDMLCAEGITMALNTFLGKAPFPPFRLLQPREKIIVSEDVLGVRPFIAGAVLRNIKFTSESLANFMGLQEKLHHTLGRNRTLLAIGAHDLDTVKGPFAYTAKPPQDISFVPLRGSKKMNAQELMEHLKSDAQLSRYLHILDGAPRYPVVLDADEVVCSLPPIINGSHSMLTIDTTNVFIEITATDQTKLDIACNIIAAMLSSHCKDEFSIEPVEIVAQGKTHITPSWKSTSLDVQVDYINQCCGLTESASAICTLLARFGYTAKPSDGGAISVSIPPTRPDVLHPCDIMEDAAIAYGYNNLPRPFLASTSSVGRPLPINKLADIVRFESAMSGWTEVMPLILCSWDENFASLNREDDGSAVKLANPKTAEYQVVRTSLLPGLLKTIRENRKVALPIKIFEVSDIVKQDASRERQARNERRWSAAFCGRSSGLEEVHGLLDRIMQMLRIAPKFEEKGDGSKTPRYSLANLLEPTFFPERAAAINLHLGDKVIRIGEFGVIHPVVLQKFGIRYPVTTLELNLEILL
ncbi:putative phenylalanine--tRNA ligase [Seiridium unicorne]|uniref:phenylalanine--tRNA ligase n=1 Tax=Seiridium unicorne TaxID=138068 RepID=A0ABR2UH70_9PEZI